MMVSTGRRAWCRQQPSIASSWSCSSTTHRQRAQNCAVWAHTRAPQRTTRPSRWHRPRAPQRPVRPRFFPSHRKGPSRADALARMVRVDIEHFEKFVVFAQRRKAESFATYIYDQRRCLAEPLGECGRVFCLLDPREALIIVVVVLSQLLDRRCEHILQCRSIGGQERAEGVGRGGHRAILHLLSSRAKDTRAGACPKTRDPALNVSTPCPRLSVAWVPALRCAAAGMTKYVVTATPPRW